MKKIILIVGILALMGAGFGIGYIAAPNPQPQQDPLGTLPHANVIDALTNTSVSVPSATSTVVLPLDLGRKYAVFVNDGSNDIYLFLGSPAVAGEGIRLNSGGGAYEINELNLYKGIVTAIATSSTSTLTVTYK